MARKAFPHVFFEQQQQGARRAGLAPPEGCGSIIYIDALLSAPLTLALRCGSSTFPINTHTAAFHCCPPRPGPPMPTRGLFPEVWRPPRSPDLAVCEWKRKWKLPCLSFPQRVRGFEGARNVTHGQPLAAAAPFLFCILEALALPLLEAAQCALAVLRARECVCVCCPA